MRNSASQNFVRIIVLRKVRWAGQVTHMREREEMHTRFLSEELNRRDRLKNLGEDRVILLR
jgi:hypothetical protein